MDTLPINWVTDQPLDSEYKRYILLAYLQSCRNHFGKVRLFPPLSELVGHYRNITQLREGLERMRDQFPKELKALESHTLEMKYEQVFPESEYISTITEVAEFAIPTLREAIQEGRDIYELVEKHIEITPVGVVPIYRDEGFLLVQEDAQREVYIYSFHHSIIPQPGENTRALALKYLYSEERTLAHTIEHIKLDLARRFREHPNPATFYCLSRLSVPLSETLLPVSKRLLLKYLAA